MAGTAVLSVAIAIAGGLLLVGFGASLRGRRRVCAGSIVVGLIAAAIAIYLGFDGLKDVGDGPVAPVVFGKLAIGLAMLLFAVGWVTWLSPQRGSAAFGFGRQRTPTRRVSRPEMPAATGVEPRGPASRRMTRPDLVAVEARTAASRVPTRSTTGPHAAVGAVRTRRKTMA